MAKGVGKVKAATPNVTVSYLSEVNSVMAKSNEEISVEILATLIQERKSLKLTPETFNQISMNVINNKTPEGLSNAELTALRQRTKAEVKSRQIELEDPVAVQ
jgi:hypothetical protein